MTRISDFSVLLFPWGSQRTSIDEIVEAARLCEKLGFHSVSLPMHLTRPNHWFFSSFQNKEVMDTLAVLPAIVATTTTIKVGTNSAILPLLPPYEWAKYMATLDLMSAGRFIAGVAMGWWQEEFQAVEVDHNDRGALFDEQLEIITNF